MIEKSCAVNTFVREMPEARIDKASTNRMLVPVVRPIRLIFAALREIFDESAYHRFLDRNHLESSPSAYAVFRQENEQSKSRRPKCC
jgi:hypothetical protein